MRQLSDQGSASLGRLRLVGLGSGSAGRRQGMAPHRHGGVGRGPARLASAWLPRARFGVAWDGWPRHVMPSLCSRPVPVRHGASGPGGAWRGKSWPGRSRLSFPFLGLAPLIMAGHGAPRQCGSRFASALPGMSGLGAALRGSAPHGRSCSAPQGKAGRGGTRRASAPQGQVGQGRACPGKSPLGAASLVRSRYGQAWPGTARPGSPTARLDTVGHGSAAFGAASRGETSRGEPRLDIVGRGKAPLGPAGSGLARLVAAVQDSVRLPWACHSRMGPAGLVWARHDPSGRGLAYHARSSHGTARQGS